MPVAACPCPVMPSKANSFQAQVWTLQGMSKIAEDSATIPEEEAVQHAGLNGELGPAEQHALEDGFEPGAPQDYKPRMSIHAHRIEIPLDPRASIDWDTPQRAIPGAMRGAMQSHRSASQDCPAGCAARTGRHPGGPSQDLTAKLPCQEHPGKPEHVRGSLAPLINVWPCGSWTGMLPCKPPALRSVAECIGPCRF